jgi:hypothetical protein
MPGMMSPLQSMRSMRSMRGEFIFRNRGPSLKVHHCQHLASVTKHDTVECHSHEVTGRALLVVRFQFRI